MTVYIESVFLENFILDYMLIKATLLTVSVETKKCRLFLCAFLGATFSLVLPLLKFNFIVETAIKLLIGLVLVSVSAKNLRGKRLYACYVIFIVYTLLVGGAVLAFYSFIGVDYTTSLSIPLVIGLGYLAVKGLSLAVNYLYRRKDIKSFIAKVTLVRKEARATLNGFFDTGNGVYDNGSPVIFASKKSVEKLFASVESFSGVKKISVQTVNGFSEKTAVKLDALEIYLGDKVNIFNNVTLCITEHGFGADYDVILSPALMEGYDAENFSKTQKAG